MVLATKTKRQEKLMIQLLQTMVTVKRFLQRLHRQYMHLQISIRNLGFMLKEVIPPEQDYTESELQTT